MEQEGQINASFGDLIFNFQGAPMFSKGPWNFHHPIPLLHEILPFDFQFFYLDLFFSHHCPIFNAPSGTWITSRMRSSLGHG